MIIFSSLPGYRTWMMDVPSGSETIAGAIRASTQGDGIALDVKAPGEGQWTRIALDAEGAEELIDGLAKVLGKKGATE